MHKTLHHAGAACHALLITTALCSAATSLAAPAGAPTGFAATTLAPKSGSAATGTVTFARSANGVEVKATVANAAPGKHGIHIHEKGDCSAADAASAGGHFNPLKHKHGAPNLAAHHAGDLGNIEVGKDGTGTATVTFDAAALKAFGDWDQIIGKSVVLHEKADDLATDPAGNAGARIACGVITKSDAKPAH